MQQTREINLASILSRDDRPRSEIVKVDPVIGAFCFFEGITSVMPLKTDLSQLHKSLMKIIPLRVSAILPYESYHVTLVSITVRRGFRSKDAYNEFITAKLPRLNLLKTYLESQDPGDLAFSVSKIDLIDDGKCSLVVDPANAITSTYLEKALARTYEILNMKPQRICWHLTLTYPVYFSRAFTEKEVKAIRDTIESHLNGKQLICSKADLCKFDSMCRFDPL